MKDSFRNHTNERFYRRTRLQFGGRAFSIAGPTVTAWNSLPKEIADMPSTERFRAQLKTYSVYFVI